MVKYKCSLKPECPYWNMLNECCSLGTDCQEKNTKAQLRIFKMDELTGYSSSGAVVSLGGNLTKWYHSAERLVVKAAHQTINFVQPQSHIVEVLGTSVCDLLHIEAVPQFLGKVIDKDGTEIPVSYSPDYRRKNEEFISMTVLLALNGVPLDSYKKMPFIMRKMAVERALSKAGIINAKQYIEDMCLIDYLLVNVDRHTGNFGVLQNIVTDAIRTVPLFDFGMGLWSYTKLTEVTQNTLPSSLKQLHTHALQLEDCLGMCKSNWMERINTVDFDTLRHLTDQLTEARLKLFRQTMTVLREG